MGYLKEYLTGYHWASMMEESWADPMVYLTVGLKVRPKVRLFIEKIRNIRNNAASIEISCTKQPMANKIDISNHCRS